MSFLLPVLTLGPDSVPETREKARCGAITRISKEPPKPSSRSADGASCVLSPVIPSPISTVQAPDDKRERAQPGAAKRMRRCEHGVPHGDLSWRGTVACRTHSIHGPIQSAGPHWALAGETEMSALRSVRICTVLADCTAALRGAERHRESAAGLEEDALSRIPSFLDF